MRFVRPWFAGLAVMAMVACSGGVTTGGAGGASATGGSSSGGSGGSGASSSGGAVGTGGVQCTGANATFPAFDRSCTTTDDCVLVRHLTSCCGSTLIMSIKSSEKAAFDAAETICDAQYPACGCAAMGVNVEDGTLIDDSQVAQVVSTCDSGQCAAHYTGETFACGAVFRCTPEQICWVTTGGPAGSPSTLSCQFSGGCTDCSCAGATGCTCDAPDGHLTVTCAAP